MTNSTNLALTRIAVLAADPALNAEQVVIGNHSNIDHHDVGGCRSAEIGDQVLAKSDQVGHCSGIEIPFGIKAGST